MRITYTLIPAFAVSLFITLFPSCGKDKTQLSVDSAVAGGMEYTVSPAGEAPIPDRRLAKGPYSQARLHVNDIGPLYEVFNDSNYLQYAYAEKLGITPISDLRSAYFTSKPVVHVRSNEFYYVDSLTHSVPFLVPHAEALLRHIGRNFIDSLSSRGYGGYRIKVTSMLRTPQSVASLRRVNKNATDSSTHKFATTFDLSWSKFYCEDESRTIHDGDLKNLLAEVLLDVRKEGRCLVKYERKTCCFHITAIK